MVLTPSELSKTVAWTNGFALDCLTFDCLSLAAAHASNSARAMRTRPHVVYNQNEWSLSSMTQCAESHGNPFFLVSVATRPFLTPLSPPCVAAQSLPSGSNRTSFTRPSPSPSAAE